MTTLNLEKALDEAQEEKQEVQETKQEETKQEETKTEEIKQEEIKTEEKKEDDHFSGMDEVGDISKTFITTSDGKRVKVQDLIDGNMRQEDYTQKTMDLAESRRQLDLARTAPEEKKESAAIDLTEQNKRMQSALAELDESDPQATTEQASEENIKNSQRLISESLEKEAKNYNLPVFTDPATKEETKTRDIWNQMVLTELQGVSQNVTLPQFNHLVNQVGKKAFKQLRGIIAAANATKVKEKTGNEDAGSPKETKTDNSSEESAQTDKNKGLTLGQRLQNSFDVLEKNRGG